MVVVARALTFFLLFFVRTYAYIYNLDEMSSRMDTHLCLGYESPEYLKVCRTQYRVWARALFYCFSAPVPDLEVLLPDSSPVGSHGSPQAVHCGRTNAKKNDHDFRQ